MNSRFFTELPGDEYGNRAYAPATPFVMEAVVEGRYMKVIAPPEIKDKWPSMLFNGIWFECEGPARFITYEQREEIIKNG